MSDLRTTGRRLLAGLFTMVLLAVVAWLGQIPFGEASPDSALRLSLRTVQGQIEICRERSPAELDALPQHMRTATVCDDHTPQYRLQVELDGRNVVDQAVIPGGLRGDRPLIVDRRLTVEPGAATLVVRFTAQSDASLAVEQQQALERLPSYVLHREVTFEAGRITLVTLDDADGELQLVNG